MGRKKKIDQSLVQGKGLLPAENQEELGRIVEAVINQWGLEKPVDIMIANRMVSTWMKLRVAEGCLEKFGMHFEDYDDNGKITRIRINEFAYYLKQLEADFRSYYRLLNIASPKDEKASPMNFMDMINDGN